MLIRRPAKEVFEVVGDIDGYPRFFVGITKWDPVGEIDGGLGDRYWILMRVGSAEAGGQIIITDWEEPHVVGWETEKGTDHSIQIRLEERGDDTLVTIDFALRLAGGAASRLAERIAGSVVKRNLRATLDALRHLCEHGEAAHLGDR